MVWENVNLPFNITMTKKIKLIWDFRGTGAIKTAEHHEIHIKEFFVKENLPMPITGFEDINEFYAIAFLVVPENEMIQFRDILKPHRGEYYEF